MADEPQTPRGNPADAFDDLDFTPAKPTPILNKIIPSPDGGLLHVTFTKDGLPKDFAFNSSEVAQIARGNGPKVADVLVADYSFPRELADKLISEISASRDFQNYVASFNLPTQESGIQNPEPSGPETQDTRPFLGGTQSYASLVNMAAPPHAATLDGDSETDAERTRGGINLDAVSRGIGTDPQSTFLVDRTTDGTLVRASPPPVPSSTARRGRADETVVIDEPVETVVLDGADTTMEFEPGDSKSTAGADTRPPLVVTRPARTDALTPDLPALVSDVPEPLQSAAPQGVRDVSRLNYQLLAASLVDDVDTAKVALANGADLECRDSIGRTPLLLASFKNSRQVFDLLREREADRTAKDDFGDTSLSLARQWDNFGIISALQDWAEDDFKKGRTGSSAALPLEPVPEQTPSVIVPDTESPTMVIPAVGESLNPQGRGDGEADRTQQIPLNLQPEPVTPTLVFPPDSEPSPVISVGTHGHALVILNDKSEVILNGGSLLRVLRASRTSGRDEAARVLTAECSGIQSDLAGLILDKVCDPNFVKDAMAQLHFARPSAPAQQEQVSQQPGQVSQSAAQPPPPSQAPAPTKGELNAIYLAAAGNGDVDAIKLAIAQGADRNTRDNENRTALMRAVAGLHLNAIRCLVEEIQVDPHAKGGGLGFTVFENLQGLGDSPEAKAVRDYLNELFEKEQKAVRAIRACLAAKTAQDTQDAATTVILLSARKTRKPVLSNLPWGWLVGSAVVVSISVLSAASSSFRNGVVNLANNISSAAKVIFTNGIEETKDGGVRFTGFSAKERWWNEGDYKLSKDDAIAVANQVLIGRMDYAGAILWSKFGISDSLTEDMLENMDVYAASRIAKTPFLQMNYGRYEFKNVYINNVFATCSISKDGMKKVVNAYVAQGTDAAVDILNDELFVHTPDGRMVSSCSAWAGVTSFSEGTLANMVRVILLSPHGRPLVGQATEQAEQKAKDKALKEVDDAAKRAAQKQLNKEMEAKDAAAIKAAAEKAAADAEAEKAYQDLLNSAITPPTGVDPEEAERLRAITLEKWAAEKKAAAEAKQKAIEDAKKTAKQAEQKAKDEARKAADEIKRAEKEKPEQDAKAKRFETERLKQIVRDAKAEQDRKSREAAAKRAMSKGADAKTKRVLSACERDCVGYGAGTAIHRACVSGCK